ncbi:MAG: helix-turn-helix transcriptional regulator [bacterium]|nr:helix-turn-helix transcriptional regulator [bacterium]
MGDMLSARLAELIQQKGMSQRELAKKANVTEAAMSHYLKGDRFPRASVLGRIAEALGTTTDYLLNGVTADSREEIKRANILIARNVAYMSHEDKMAIISILLGNG